MTDAPAPAAGDHVAARRSAVSEVKVSAHLLALDPGLFCIVHTARGAHGEGGLPGVRLSTLPADTEADAVAITGFRADGWLHGTGDAALVRVSRPAQVLVTVYQRPDVTDAAPDLQVLRLSGDTAGIPAAPAPVATPTVMDVVAHIQKRGDVGGMLGEWMGVRGTGDWIEGFGIAPSGEIGTADIEYQAVLGRDWLSPWVEGGQFCGSRGMGLPILGLRLRLRGRGAETHEAEISASFVDGTAIGPLPEDSPIQADSLAPLEAFLVVVRPRAAAKARSRAAARR